MKCRQYEVKVFEMKIENDSSFIGFMENNYELLRNHLLSLKGEVSEKVKEYLQSKNLVYVDNINLPIKKRSTKDVCIIAPPEAVLQSQITPEEKVEQESKKEQKNLESQENLEEKFSKDSKEQLQSKKIVSKEEKTYKNMDEDLLEDPTKEQALIAKRAKASILSNKIPKEEVQIEQNLNETSKLLEVTPQEDEPKRVKIKEKDIIEKTPIIEDYGYGSAPLKVLNRPLRSGQFIQHDGAVLVMERVNSGAKIVALGSVIVLNVVEGDISSTGECMIIPRVKKGNIFFHGYRIELDRLKYPLNKLIFVGDRIVIQAITKKELI